jgi:hypothetical protein
MDNRRFPSSFYNPVSLAGAVLAAVSFATILFLTAVDLLQASAPAYIGVVSYIILPVPLLIGLVLIPLGAWRERRRVRRGEPATRMSLTFDFSQPHQRRVLTVFAGGTLLLLLFTAYGSYRTFEWTESVEFCGTTCHKVMEPEHTAYQHSPHARVKCVDCHVGSGAGWYVRSKLSGAYQVYATALNIYPRPIPTPIANLRPAQETCEQCHWPSHFSGEKKYVNTYFRSDEENSRWTIALLMKIGGGSRERGGQTSGIHWHMNIANEITYASADSLHQVIPWVRSRNRETGRVVEFRSTENELTPAQMSALPTSRMDCIDCHNRPAHIYRPPVRLVDQSLALGDISTALPSVRTAAIDVLVQPYATTEGAVDSIPLLLTRYYQEQYPEVAAGKADLIRKAAAALIEQYRRNFFPQMHVSWKAYPNNIGHMTDIGCFRCHDGKHVSADGRTISKDCNTCHTILYQGPEAVPTAMNLAGETFRHPADIGDAWMETNCKECHSGQ